MTEKDEAIQELARLVGWLSGLSDVRPAFVSRVVIPALDRAVRPLALEIEGRHIVDDDTEGTTLRATHYTSLETVLGMLSQETAGGSASLRLYDSLHCNDPEEGNFLVNSLSSTPEHRWLAEGSSGGHAYIASLIVDEQEQDLSDELLFWRTYGNEGSGCSLTMVVETKLLRRVLYGEEPVALTREQLSPVLDVIQPLAERYESLRKEMSDTIWRRLEAIRFLYKNSAYDFEHECRVVLTTASPGYDQSKVGFEPRGNGAPLSPVRHFYEMDELTLKSTMTSGSKLVLGPCVPDKYSVKLYLEHLQRQAGIDYFRFEISEIPYRAS